jgi:hypothetical protein
MTESNNRKHTKIYIVKCELTKFMIEIRWCDGAGQEARELACKMPEDNLFQVNQYNSTGIGGSISYCHQRQHRSGHSGAKGAKRHDQNVCSSRISIQCLVSDIDHRHSQLAFDNFSFAVIKVTQWIFLLIIMAFSHWDSLHIVGKQ